MMPDSAAKSISGKRRQDVTAAGSQQDYLTNAKVKPTATLPQLLRYL